MEGKIKVLVIDHNLIVTELLADALNLRSDFSCRAVSTVSEAIASVKSEKFDVVLFECDISRSLALEDFGCLVQGHEGRIAVFSANVSFSFVERTIDKGGRGFISKKSAFNTVVHAIKLIAAGEVYIPSDFFLNHINNYFTKTPFQSEPLKPREEHVLRHLCEGLSNKEIGSLIGVAEATVKTDVASICRKLGAKNRTQAVLTALASL